MSKVLAAIGGAFSDILFGRLTLLALINLVLAGVISFFNPGLVVIGGGVAGLGHVLLAEIRGVVYRRSPPLATGNLPIVLSELGDTAGVLGATRLISDHIFSAT